MQSSHWGAHDNETDTEVKGFTWWGSARPEGSEWEPGVGMPGAALD